MTSMPALSDEKSSSRDWRRFNCLNGEYVHKKLRHWDWVGWHKHAKTTGLLLLSRTIWAGKVSFDMDCTKQDLIVIVPCRCSVCRGPWYCGEECQAEHWPLHRLPAVHIFNINVWILQLS